MRKPVNDTPKMPKKPEISASLPALSREVLAGIEERGWVKGEKVSYGTRGKQTRCYSEEETRKLFLLSRCYALGLGTQQINKVLNDPTQLIPTDVGAFLDATSRLCDAVLIDDAKSLARKVVIEGARILAAECVLLFLEPETSPGKLRLAAGCARSGSSERLFDTDPGAGYSQWLSSTIPRHESSLAHTQTTLRASGKWPPLRIDEILNLFASEVGAFPPPKHLPSGRYYSWLCLALRDRKGRFFGYLVAENRLGPKNETTPIASFDGVAEQLGKQYAAFLSRLFQFVPLVMMEERLFPLSLRTEPLNQFLKQALRIGILMTRGFRGEIAIYEEGNGMTIRARRPLSGELPPGARLPNRSISRYVFETGEPQLVPDVHKHDLYFMCHKETLSQLTVPIKFPFSIRPFGTLTVESHLRNGFDRTDLTNLEHLAAQIGSHLSIIEKNTALNEALTDFYESTGRDDSGWPLTGLLDQIYREFGFTSGVVYVADYSAAELRVLWARGCTSAVTLSRIRWRFSEKSLATKVFLEQKPYFTANPSNDVFVHRDGLKAFGDWGPLLGVPITFHRFVVGVLVVFSQNDTKPKLEDAQRLESFSRLLVTSAPSREESSLRTIKSLHGIQSSIRAGRAASEIFPAILKSLISRFDRARILQYWRSEAGSGPYFECLHSTGKDEEDDKYKGKRVHCSDSPYLKRIVETPMSDATPHFFTANELGPDPLANIWDRPADFPWGMTYLYDQDQIWGYLAVDNVKSARRLDSAENERTAELCGWLAELAIARSRR